MKYHIEELNSACDWKKKGTKTFDTYDQAERYASKTLKLDDDSHIYRIKGQDSELDKLTDKERDVLRLLLAGVSNVDIAEKLNCGLRTVELRRHVIFKKLKVKKVAQLVRKVC